MSEKRRFEDVTFRPFVERHAAEHEVFLCFNNDEDAVEFQEWWDGKGAYQFQKYLDKQREER